MKHTSVATRYVTLCQCKGWPQGQQIFAEKKVAFYGKLLRASSLETTVNTAINFRFHKNKGNYLTEQP
jgi:hypothetical protein